MATEKSSVVEQQNQTPTDNSPNSAQQQFQTQNSFCEEIDFQEIKRLEVLGRGTYGLVQRAAWREKIVAVKMIDSEMERRAFYVEVKQLSRVRHENIVQLYGACTQQPVCLVMEYAEGGSLYNVLHGRNGPAYKAAHAMSWSLQCGRGVDYLHNLKPKALVHRDLKPPNLLLVDGGRKLKICDFGTACDLQTYMTNNKGSAAWMAPEVFEGSSYTEKCDVFSWGIIIWEVLTRLKPFEELGGPAFRIMWAVHAGSRPQPIKNCPKPIEILMVSCWDRDPEKRPSMSNVVQRMEYLMQFFKGADEPIVYSDLDDSLTPSAYSTRQVYTNDNTISSQTEGLLVPTLITAKTLQPTVVQEDRLASLQSAPASLAGSEEDLAKSNVDDHETSQSTVPAPTEGISDAETSGARSKGHRRTGSFDIELLKAISERAGEPSKERPPKPPPKPKRPGMSLALKNVYSPSNQNGQNKEDSPTPISMAYIYLESHLQPVEPCPEVIESMQIYREHCQMADEYLQMQEEILLLTERKQELILQLHNDIKEESQTSTNQHCAELLREKEQLQNLRDSLKRELESLRREQRKA